MHFVRVRDIDVCYELSGSGPPLLKIWGTGGDLRRIPSEFDHRLTENFTVLAYDQRGMGRSGKPVQDYRMADYADDAAALMDAMGWNSAAVLGYSFGGMVAQEFALRHPERVARLVLASTSPGGAGGSSYPLCELFDHPDEERVQRFLELSDLRRTPQWQVANPTIWQAMLADALAGLRLGDDDPEHRPGARRQLAARRGHDTWERLPGLSMPISVFAGRHDGIAPPEVQRRLAGHIRGAGYREFEGGHLFFLQDTAAPAAIIEALGG